MMNPLAGPAGPGKFSTRTDNLQMGSTAYGEGVDTQAIKSGAPLSTTPDVNPARAGDVRATAQAPVTELYAPTQRPNEPITHGINIGDGGDASVLAMRQPDDSNFRMNIDSAKPVLAYIADLPNTSPETRAAIAQLWNMQ